MNAKLLRIVAVTVFVTIAASAHAGRSCEQKRPEAATVMRAMTLAEHVAQQLDATGAQVVVLARMGQDLSKYGQRYSHMGLAYREGNTWRVAHKLNQCGTAEASVYRQGLGEFFLLIFLIAARHVFHRREMKFCDEPVGHTLGLRATRAGAINNQRRVRGQQLQKRRELRG